MNPLVMATLGVFVASGLAACSASSEEKPGGPAGSGGSPIGGAGGGIGGQSGGGAVGAGGVSTGAGGFLNLSGSTSSGGAGSGGGENCGVQSKPEEIIQYSPAGIFIMQDRSGSMVTGFPPPASPQGWANSTTAITAFVNDPSSAGLRVGLGSFPPMSGATDCTAGATCGAPIVPIAELPGNAQQMIAGMQSATPNNPLALTPIECGLRGMVATCKQFTAANNNMPCAAVLVTDGTPTECSGDPAVLSQVVAEALTAGVKTFVIGLPGSNITQLDQLAAAGGTTKAVDVGQGSAEFVKALNSIRTAISVGTKLQCEWIIPPPPAGQVFDRNKVNLTFTPKGGAPVDFGYVASEGECANASNAWRFDNEADPKKILVCPGTCDTLKNSSGAEMAVSFGCARKPAIIQ